MRPLIWGLLLALPLSLLASESAFCQISSESMEEPCMAFMYSLSDVNGFRPASISVSFDKFDVGKSVNLIVYPTSASKSVGCRVNDNRYYVCTPDVAKVPECAKLCTPATFGEFIVSVENPETLGIRKYNRAFLSTEASLYDVSYPVEHSGQFLVFANSNSIANDKFVAKVTFMAPYGLLPAPEYPKLVFYGVVSLVYLIIGIIWLVLNVKHWLEILPIQNYLSGLVFLVMLEMSLHFGYYDNFNRVGKPSTALFVLIIASNSLRNSFSIFLLLIVSLGFGVVRPSLGDTMRRCQILGAAHFIFGLLYASGTMIITEETRAWAICFVLPLAFCMTVFYWWTLHALKQTRHHLETRRQNQKLFLYNQLWRILALSLCSLVLFFIVNTVYFANRGNIGFYVDTWKVRWFMTDGWLNLLYLLVLTLVLVLWRPTPFTRFYGLAEELVSEDCDLEAMGSMNEHIKRREGWGDEDEGLTSGNKKVFRKDDEDPEEDPEEIMKWVEQHVGLGDGDGDLGDRRLNQQTESDEEIEYGLRGTGSGRGKMN